MSILWTSTTYTTKSTPSTLFCSFNGSTMGIGQSSTKSHLSTLLKVFWHQYFFRAKKEYLGILQEAELTDLLSPESNSPYHLLALWLHYVQTKVHQPAHFLSLLAYWTKGPSWQILYLLPALDLLAQGLKLADLAVNLLLLQTDSPV